MFCTFYSIAHFTLYLFLPIYALVLCYFYIIFIILHCPLSGPDLIYISLLIIPCIIYYVTNKETLNLDNTHKAAVLSVGCASFSSTLFPFTQLSVNMLGYSTL